MTNWKQQTAKSKTLKIRYTGPSAKEAMSLLCSRRTTRVSRINEFYTCNSLQIEKVKSINRIHGIYRVIHKRSNIASSFVEHQKFPKWRSFTHGMWVIVADWDKQIRIRTFYTLKVLYAGCSTKKIDVAVYLVEHLEYPE